MPEFTYTRPDGFTSHGHRYGPGTATDIPDATWPIQAACGGLAGCEQCLIEALTAFRDARHRALRELRRNDVRAWVMTLVNNDGNAALILAELDRLTLQVTELQIRVGDLAGRPPTPNPP